MGTDSSSGVSDVLLVSNYLKGDRKSLQVLYNRYFPKVYRMCFSFSKNRDDAFDLTQDILMKAFSQAASFRGNSRFSTWLYSIAHNHCISHTVRRKKLLYEDIKAAGMMMADGITGDEYEERCRKEEKECRMNEFLDLLPETEKRMLLLKYRSNYSVRELQNEFNLSASAVKMRLMRARQKVTAQV